jgi:hypothetical protein
VLGVDHPVTASEAAALKAQTDAANGVMPLAGGIPTPWIGVGSWSITGGKTFWGSWDFPDSWAGQGSPLDLAALEESTDSCTRTQNGGSNTFNALGAQTNLAYTRSVRPNQSWLWNVNDYMSGFVSQADHGTVWFDIVRTATCGTRTLNVGVAFDYEANQGGSITGISFSLFGFSVSYSGVGLEGHWGTNPAWVYIYP